MLNVSLEEKFQNYLSGVDYKLQENNKFIKAQLQDFEERLSKQVLIAEEIKNTLAKAQNDISSQATIIFFLQAGIGAVFTLLLVIIAWALGLLKL